MYLPYDTKDTNTTEGIPCAISTGTDFFSDKQRGFSSGGDEIIATNSSPFCDKSDQSLPLKNDVYAFIAVAPVMSTPFFFALYVVFVKYCVCGLLAFGIQFDNIGASGPADDVVKFLLIPVAIAMQEDLVHVYASVANIIYDGNVLKISQSATQYKLIFAFILRFIDGLLGLYVNFALMLDTSGALNIMLNFAALHFLQGIDDVFFGLVEQGFFGDVMEHMSTLCKQVTFPRRSVSGCMTEVDSMLFFLTLAVCFSVYGVYVSGIIDYV